MCLAAHPCFGPFIPGDRSHYFDLVQNNSSLVSFISVQTVAVENISLDAASAEIDVSEIGVLPPHHRFVRGV